VAESGGPPAHGRWAGGASPPLIQGVLRMGRQIWVYPLLNAISAISTYLDLLLIITGSADELSGDTNIDDLERP